MSKREITLADNNTALLVCGDLNKNLADIEEGAGVSIQARGSQLTVNGPKHEVELAVSSANKLQELIRAGYPVYPSDVAYALRILQASPKSINQKLYIDSIRTHDIVFGIGPAGLQLPGGDHRGHHQDR